MLTSKNGLDRMKELIMENRLIYFNNNVFLLQICTWCPKINATFETPGIQSIFKIFTKFQKEYNSFK